MARRPVEVAYPLVLKSHRFQQDEQLQGESLYRHIWSVNKSHYRYSSDVLISQLKQHP